MYEAHVRHQSQIALLRLDDSKASKKLYLQHLSWTPRWSNTIVIVYERTSNNTVRPHLGATSGDLGIYARQAASISFIKADLHRR